MFLNNRFLCETNYFNPVWRKYIANSEKKFFLFSIFLTIFKKPTSRYKMINTKFEIRNQRFNLLLAKTKSNKIA